MQTGTQPSLAAVTGGDYTGKRAVVLTATLIVGVLSYQLNASMLSPALPNMSETLNRDIGSVSLVSSVFFLAGAVAGMIFTRWSDYIGRRKGLLIVLGVLTVGTLLCVFAPNLETLLLGRVLQGASNATFNFSYLLLAKHLAPRVFGTAVGFVSAVNGGVGGIDGYVGGLMAESLGFRSIFVVILAFSMIAIIASWRVIPRDTPSAQAGRMDWWGALVLGVVLIALTQTINGVSSSGWTAGILLWAAAAVFGAVVFVFVERRRKYPLVPMEDLTSRHVWPVLMTTILSLASVFSTLTFSIILIAENDAGYGLPASLAALLFLTPAALLGAVAAPVAGTIAGRTSWLTTLRIGLGLSVILLVGIAFLIADQWITLALVALTGVTFNGIVLTSLNGLSVVQSPPHAPATLPGLNGSSFGIGASLGIAVAAPFINQANMASYQWAVCIATLVGMVALGISFIIKPRTDNLVSR